MWLMYCISSRDNSILIRQLQIITKQSYALVYDPIAEYFFKHKMTFDGSSFSIDHSHGVPEVEYHIKISDGRTQRKD